MNNALITDTQLAAALGVLPQEGHTQLQSPTGTTHQLSTDIRLHGNDLAITTHECGVHEQERVDMLALFLQRNESGWEIKKQLHSGLEVYPDAELALQSLVNNLSATPINPQRKPVRP